MTTTVAIIEDNLEFLNWFAKIIESEPEFSLVGCAASGAEGCALITDTCADVYLVDLGLPDMDGAEVIRHAVGTHTNCEVLVITTLADDESIIKSIGAGATGYLLKDSSLFELTRSIRLVRNGGSPFSPTIARKLLRKFQLNKATRAPTSTKEAIPPVELTDRETQILQLLATGLRYKEIGDSLCISAYTVAQHIRNIYPKLSVHSRGEAIYEASKMGLIKV
jgi:DNA-binding NarL/FixJ family response regulator